MRSSQSDFPTPEFSESDLRHPSTALFSRGIRFGWLRSILFIVLDAAMVTMAWVFAKRLAAAVPWFQTVGSFSLLSRNPQQVGFLAPILIITLGMIAAAGLYGERSFRRRYSNLVICLTLSQILLVTITFLYQPGVMFSRSTFSLAWILTVILVILGRWSAEITITLLRQGGTITRKIALVGYPDDMERAALMLHLVSKKEFTIVAQFDIRNLDDLEHWHTQLHQMYAEEVGEIFMCSWQSVTNPMEFYWNIKTTGLNLRILPVDLEIPNQRPKIEMIGSLPTIVFSPPALLGTDFWLKRIFDLIASAAILILASPLYITLAILIKLDSPGPIFYKQKRVGLRGRQIKVWKFRTMVQNADKLQAKLESQNQTDGVLFKIKDDPRITSVGKFLRRYSLDEIPQVINVLLGNMSLVGPRPLPLRDVERFEEHHHLRHNVMPGITGLWQVSGRSDIIDFDEAFKLDITYIQNWSLGLDFQILMRTVKVVLGKDGAY
ncbi:MAG: sugar transferase [Spirulina sp. SIO3F2]|nr:sugar transferase [Spirulina sp. SIO3F2]